MAERFPHMRIDPKCVELYVYLPKLFTWKKYSSLMNSFPGSYHNAHSSTGWLMVKHWAPKENRTGDENGTHLRRMRARRVLPAPWGRIYRET